jgi:ubiquinone/menaquinone biosynthesis C-methylase UbiE
MPLDRSVNYERIAPVFDQRYQNKDDFEYRGVQSSLLEFVGSSLSRDVLEVGCGTGHWLTVLTNAGCRVVGLEPARNMIDIGRRVMPQAVLVQGKAEALPLEEKVFDRVVCINAFQHFSDKKHFVQEAYRVLKPGGGIMISGLDPHTGLDRWWIYDYFPQVIDIDRKRFLPAQSIQAMMHRSGFVECCTNEVQHIPIQIAARTALEQGILAKTSTSQLIVLTDEEYIRGISKLRQDIESAEAAQGTLTISADLRFYTTTGWVPL